ncbi:ATP-binding domain-containing protein [Nostoc flagelliforme FACHB-838]|uniref:ATP-binding domain-containing protein n=1 Tax=Nostoc flagelliforme FACHB-838 TaxID=2692904 RepID=A0ABR8E4S5_9NOSO|nr:ATP-binding domain-containing protein [Nostoc flagelliforme FACHB-838]
MSGGDSTNLYAALYDVDRNLFYTGITRAKKLAIVVGAKKAISLAVRSTDAQKRYTRLQQRLLQAELHW